MREFWIVIGKAADPENYNDAASIGQVEYQFSDGPSGERTSSFDFLSLEDGLKALCPAIFHWEDRQ